jgi:HK97 family phage major capsid protein
LVNQDISSQLHLMTLGIGAAGIAVYMPPGGLSDKPYATLMGAPVIETEFNATLGTQGDILLVDLSHYVTASKGNMDAQTSMHLYFDTAEQAFRMTFRIDGQSWWAAPLTPYKGTATQSMVVALDTRA